MDEQQFDALAKAIHGVSTRRFALGSLTGGAVGLIALLSGEEANAHDPSKRCKNIGDKKKRQQCIKKGKEHKKWHETNACRSLYQPCGDRPCCPGESLSCSPGRECFPVVTHYLVPYPSSESGWQLTQGEESGHYAWNYPLPGRGLARDYGFPANGLDIRTDKTILAAAPGRVVNSSIDNAWVAIDHGNGDISFYLHVANIKVAPGTPVTSSTPLGNPSILPNKDGFRATAPHLHFAFASYDASSAPGIGGWDPNHTTWRSSFPEVRHR